MKRKIIIIIFVIVIAIGGFFGYRSYQKAQADRNSEFQTIELERGELRAIVGATGTVRADQMAVISWQTTGTIETIHVNLDDQVAADEVLAELEESSLPQNVILAKSDLVTAERALEELHNSEAASAQAQLALAQATIALEDALEDREKKEYRRTSDNTLDGIRADYILAQQTVEDAESVYSGVEDRAEDDPIRAQALSQLVNARKARDRAKYNLDYALGLPDEEEVAEADAKVEVAKANLEDAEREWERLKDGVDPEDVEAAEARVAAIEATLALARLEAPFGGAITEVRSKVGDQVSPGTVSFRIDDLSRVLVDVEIPEVDINSIALGQPAMLTFDAVQGKEYSGVVDEVARVGTVSPDGVDFTVTMELADEDEEVKPGMTGAVNIIVNQLDDVLLVPNRAVRMREGQRVIFILREGVPEVVEIEIGASSEMYSELIAGDVEEGELIILNPPVEFEPGPGGGGEGRRLF